MIISNSANQVVPVKRIAAIDLGTNSFHAIIVDVYSDGSFRTLDKLKEMVELAKGGVGKRLSEGAFKRGMKALRNIKRLADSYECEKILAYATSAIREAENGGEFIQKSIDDLNIKINAIPGRLEAELIGHAIRHGVKLTEKPVLVADIGGGSVEFILGNDKEFFFTTSKKIGVSRMTEVYKPADPITQEDIETLENHYEEQLQDVAQAFAQHRTDTIIGSSGTMENIAEMIANRQKKPTDVTVNELEFSAEEFREFYDYFIKLDRKKRKKVSGLDTKRIGFINTGVVLLDYMIRKFGIKNVRISSQALREGIVIRYLKKEMIGLPWSGAFADPRRRSVFELLRKTDWHETHSRHVANMALTIFDALEEEMELEEGDRQLLEYAAYLHDIGYYISHSKHHKHALYIIRHADLKGFKEEEIEIIANVARYHRRSTPKKRHGEYWKLKPAIRKRIKKLSGILRVADGLDRSHYQNVQDLDVFSEENEIKINIRTEGEPYLEIWGAERKCQLLKEMTGKKINIERVLQPAFSG
ncbi:Ppx/GppA phosphatase family protein [Gracilimonas mengyeensis]|uniref:Exopolyphosphatase / guanosine-5'-triphosphate,3'-diphosphate pyrophosphatase n=1 Tax=Gracilimonas mengyeensis TaxID=1302730 RepID=A0A521DEH6_9BACT|nr:Ppx/GppA phosphatase family protein [Gracilimonas mengyeensis]SMO69360.1 exopolyphosphatase / guanosine-5'-triphosphate,3'-diphosphate pyrophosphatase [Gracilimonas mengyeensis]